MQLKLRQPELELVSLRKQTKLHAQSLTAVAFITELSEFIKVLRCAEFKSQEVISLAFSHDSKYLLAQGGPPDYRFVFIDGDDLPVSDPDS